MTERKQKVKFGSLSVRCGSEGEPVVDLSLILDGKEEKTQSSGSGPIDALFNCIKTLVPHGARLELYQVHAVTGGTDAQAEVTVRLEKDRKVISGHGRDTDTIVASAKAYISAVNKLLHLEPR